MIDNFEKLVDLGVVKFIDPDLFYFIQIIKRKKDNPDLHKSEKVVRSYYVNNYSDYYGKVKDSIIRTCFENNARAYIRVNRRSYFKAHIRTIKYLAELLEYEQHSKVPTAYDTVLGRYSADPEKKWVIDIDFDDKINKYDKFILDIETSIHTLLTESGNTFHGFVPTPNGQHIISGAFNLKKFRDSHPSIDIHKDNPTILYSNLK